MTDGPAHASTRIDDLEVRIAHQDSVIADLNDVITSQWRKISALERQIALLREEFQNGTASREALEPPPHY